MTLSRVPPVIFEPTPTTRRSIPHSQLSDDKLIRAILGHNTLTHISTHSNIDQDPEILHRPGTLRFICLHSGSSINIPHQFSLASLLILIPSEVKPHSILRIDGRNRCLHYSVFIMVFAVEVTPMHTSMICLISIPRFHYIHFSIVGPGKWVFWQ